MKPLLIILFLLSTVLVHAQSGNDLINLLQQKNIITEAEADSLRSAHKTDSSSVGKKLPFTVSGYGQIRFQSFQEAGKPDYLELRRARLDLRGTAGKKWEYRLQADLTGNPKLLDLYGTWLLSGWIKLQAGQFKIPFSMENIQSSNTMETIDRSQVVEALVARGQDVLGNFNGRDIGIEAFGSLIRLNKRHLIDYSAGVFNGNGINNSDNNEIKDVSARVVIHALQGLDIGGSWYCGYDKFGNPAVNKVRSRLGGEFLYIYKFATLRGEYIEGHDGDKDKRGAYLQASAFIYKRKLQLVGRYDYFDSNTGITDNATTHYLSGINYYFNDLTRIQVNVSARVEEVNSYSNDLINAQFQIGF